MQIKQKKSCAQRAKIIISTFKFTILENKCHQLPDVAVFVLWKSEPPKPAKAPPKERPVDAVVVVAVVPPKLFRVNPVEALKRDSKLSKGNIIYQQHRKIQIQCFKN